MPIQVISSRPTRNMTNILSPALAALAPQYIMILADPAIIPILFLPIEPRTRTVSQIQKLESALHMTWRRRVYFLCLFEEWTN